MEPDYLQLTTLTAEHMARWSKLSEMDILPTKFYDVPTLKQLGMFEITKRMLDHAGLAEFVNKCAPTYKRYVLEFLSTLSVRDDNRISFHLNDVERCLSYDELRDILGVSRQPTLGWKNTGNKIKEVWEAITGRKFDSSKGEINSSLGHPCLILAHKVIRMAFGGQVEICMFSISDLTWFRCFFEECRDVPDWAFIFVASCIRDATSGSSKGKLVLGGMITLIARKWELEPPEGIDPVHGYHQYNEKSLQTAKLLSNQLEQKFGTRAVEHWKWKPSTGCERPIYLPCSLPFGTRAVDFRMIQNQENRNSGRDERSTLMDMDDPPAQEIKVDEMGVSTEEGMKWDTRACPNSSPIDQEGRDMKKRENSDFKQFRGPGVRLEKLWGGIFGDSYATGENCVVRGMDCPPDTNLEHESNVLESQLGTPDPDTAMTKCDHSAEKLGRLDPGFFRGSHTSPGEGQTSSTPTSPTLAPMPSAPKRPSPISSGGSRSSPLGSSSDRSKRAKLSQASMFRDVSELQEEGKRTNTLTGNLCAAGNFVTQPLTPATHPPPIVDRVPSIQDAFSILYMMSDEGLLERRSDEFYFAAHEILDEKNRQEFMFLCSNRHRLAWLKDQMKKNK